ncbi:MAG: helix-turn-helix domain-containing protein [Bacteroidia bacterium]|jgi:transcriptional regulator with XRE-family HTH domain|nr:helix-turn-helix domain-containing protein [Bacteroidota bacterium]MBL7914446.1 helix-turn-helix domain-containing protein [Bacteroidia bacterium]OQA08554.1 MAG: helix-turn-helix protein [Bacteroidetes bacterium ADurb.Bin397]MBK7969256.1 helix-turn-helix domain-containing protein [Bacteroidota bacterium]MBK8416539.1 helix-turn-helix domain-containing protein [Bacteroidota bacterium]
MEIPVQQLAPLLKSRRKDLKIKQEDLSETTGVALRTIRDLEKGLGNPSLHTLEKVMQVLGIELIFRLRK